MKKAESINSVLKFLDYTKTNKKWYDDKELVAGYHSVSILGERFKGQRDPEMRLAKVDYDFTDKRVLDVGARTVGCCTRSQTKWPLAWVWISMRNASMLLTH